MSFFPLLYQHLRSAPWLDSISATNAPGTTSTFLCFQLPTGVLQAFQSANPYPASLIDMVSHGDHVGLPKTFTKLKITMKVKLMLNNFDFVASLGHEPMDHTMQCLCTCWKAMAGPPGKKTQNGKTCTEVVLIEGAPCTVHQSHQNRHATPLVFLRINAGYILGCPHVLTAWPQPNRTGLQLCIV